MNCAWSSWQLLVNKSNAVSILDHWIPLQTDMSNHWMFPDKSNLIGANTHPGVSVAGPSCMVEGVCWVLVINLQARLICDAPVEEEFQTVHKHLPNITLRPWLSVPIIILAPELGYCRVDKIYGQINVRTMRERGWDDRRYTLRHRDQMVDSSSRAESMS